MCVGAFCETLAIYAASKLRPPGLLLTSNLGGNKMEIFWKIDGRFLKEILIYLRCVAYSFEADG